MKRQLSTIGILSVTTALLFVFENFSSVPAQEKSGTATGKYGITGIPSSISANQVIYVNGVAVEGTGTSGSQIIVCSGNICQTPTIGCSSGPDFISVVGSTTIQISHNLGFYWDMSSNTPPSIIDSICNFADGQAIHQPVAQVRKPYNGPQTAHYNIETYLPAGNGQFNEISFEESNIQVH